jgi:predicted nucleic acid-binding protein
VILVDTSIWIDLFSAKPHFSVSTDKFPFFATCPPVVQEVLQGIRGKDAYTNISLGLRALNIFADPVPLQVYIDAANIFRELRAKGLTIRSSADCLIAAVAIKHDLIVWHNDRDFDMIARIRPLQATKKI